MPVRIGIVGVGPGLHARVDEDFVTASIRLLDDGVDPLVEPLDSLGWDDTPCRNRYSMSATGVCFPSRSFVHTVIPLTNFRTMTARSATVLIAASRARIALVGADAERRAPLAALPVGPMHALPGLAAVAEAAAAACYQTAQELVVFGVARPRVAWHRLRLP
jgi:hypothetical protein